MILDHAAQLFANRGYSATSINQVAEACGFSKASLYHYYRDKYSLLISIAENHVPNTRSAGMRTHRRTHAVAHVLIPLPHQDFDPSEVAVPWRILTQAGHHVEHS